MGVVGSAGRELMRKTGKFDLGTFLDNNLKSDRRQFCVYGRDVRVLKSIRKI